MKEQLESWDGSKTVKLWIVKTNSGIKRTWKTTEPEARNAATAIGLRVLSIRAGTEQDALVA
jgi:hypothetical protein